MDSVDDPWARKDERVMWTGTIYIFVAQQESMMPLDRVAERDLLQCSCLKVYPASEGSKSRSRYCS